MSNECLHHLSETIEQAFALGQNSGINGNRQHAQSVLRSILGLSINAQRRASYIGSITKRTLDHESNVMIDSYIKQMHNGLHRIQLGLLRVRTITGSGETAAIEIPPSLRKVTTTPTTTTTTKTDDPATTPTLPILDAKSTTSLKTMIASDNKDYAIMHKKMMTMMPRAA
jgi:hypothetical protein